MTIPLAVGDVLKFTVGATVAGQKCQTSMHQKITSQPVAPISWNTHFSSMKDYMENNFWATVKQYVSNEVTDAYFQMQTIAPVRYVADRRTFDDPAGTNITDLLPIHDAVVLSRFGDLAGKQYRSRNYLWGWTEGSQDNGLIPAGDVTILQGMLQDFFVGAGGGGADVGWIWGIQTFAPPVVPGGPWTPRPFQEVTRFRVSRIIRTQRRRMIGRGE